MSIYRQWKNHFQAYTTLLKIVYVSILKRFSVSQPTHINICIYTLYEYYPMPNNIDVYITEAHLA